MTEPRFVRVKTTQRVANIFPRCQRCGRILERYQMRWCGPACRANAWYWKNQLDLYWQRT